jgi:hypothetical protein
MRQKILCDPKPLPDGLDEFQNHPFLVFKTDDLSTPLNELYRQQYNDTKKELACGLTKEEFNRPVLETVDYTKLKRSEYFESDSESDSSENDNPNDGYRLILDTPFATDGKYIYVPTYISNHYRNSNSIKQIVIEKYCPKTWAFIEKFDFMCKKFYEDGNSSDDRYDEGHDYQGYFSNIL